MTSQANPYLNPTGVRSALRGLGVRPTHEMGQNFLIDAAALATIVDAAALRATDRVLEIGPGLGVLTWELLQRAGRVVAVELDKRLEQRLRSEFASEPRLTLIQGDILRFAPGTLVGDGAAYKVVANVPYAITSPLLRHLLEAAQRPELIVVLVQWEVAQRIAAQPGDLSVLAHSVQLYAEPEIVARVPAASFVPAPAVDSAVLRLHVRPAPALPLHAITPVMRLIKAGFLQSRKQLGNALPAGMKAMGMPASREAVAAALQAAGIAATRRAETLSLAEWAAIEHELHSVAASSDHERQ